MTLIGFRRNIYLEWLEEAATLVCMGDEDGAIRAQLDHSLSSRIASDVNRRQAIDILANTWLKSRVEHPILHATALRLFQKTTAPDDHIALHYGMTLLAYPFFRQAAQIIGQTLRFGGAVRTATLQEKMPQIVGDLGAVRAACKRVTFSLRNWGILVDGAKRYEYVAREPRLQPSQGELACWMLAASLEAGPANQLPLRDLVRAPELFPFEMDVTAQSLNACRLLDVQRTGGGWDVVAMSELT